jgi:hypothetical protein
MKDGPAMINNPSPLEEKQKMTLRSFAEYLAYVDAASNENLFKFQNFTDYVTFLQPIEMIARLKDIHEVHRFKVELENNEIIIYKGKCKIKIQMYKGKNTKVIMTIVKDPLVGDMFSFQIAVKSMLRLVNKGSVANQKFDFNSIFV